MNHCISDEKLTEVTGLTITKANLHRKEVGENVGMRITGRKAHLQPVGHGR